MNPFYKPALSRQEVCESLGSSPENGLPSSTMAMIDRKGQGLPWFKLGRRDFVLYEDYIAWLKKLSDEAKRNPPKKRKEDSK